MNLDNVYALAAMLPSTSADSLLSNVFICAVVLAAALLYAVSTERNS